VELDQEYEDWIAEKRVHYWHKWWLGVVRRQLKQSTKVPLEDLDAEVVFQEEKTKGIDGD